MRAVDWSVMGDGLVHVLKPHSPNSIFRVKVVVEKTHSPRIQVLGHCCHLTVWVASTMPPTEVVEGEYFVDGCNTPDEVRELRRKAKRLAKKLLNRQAALL